MVLPASAIMYASGSTEDNSDSTDQSDFLPDNVDSSSSDGVYRG